MKRRLDLALALVHRPRILFLDEPTTGLDIQSRTALWEEVGGSRKDEGVTVFLTTQYLEEADVLADRVGIIDHGQIVAEGTPAALKAEIGRPTVEVGARRPGRAPSARPRSSRASASPCASAHGVAVRLRTGEADLAEIVRALDAEEHRDREAPAAPALARRRLPREDRPLARGRGRRRRSEQQRRRARDGARRVVTATADQVYLLGRRSVVRTIRQPANVDRAARLPADAARGQLRRAARRRRTCPGFPTGSFVAFVLAVPFIQGALFATMNAGTDLARDIQTGFLNRLSLTPMRGVALLAGQLGGVVTLGLLQAVVYLAVGLIVGVRFASGPAGRRSSCSCFCIARRARLRRARLVRGAAHRLGRGGAGPLPGVLRLPVHLVDGDPAQPDRRRPGSATSRPRTRSRT